MSSSGSKRTRLERVAALELPPSHWRRMLEVVGHRQIWSRLLLAFGLAVLLCVVVRGWAPPFEFRVGEAPSRTVVARVSFEDPLESQRRREWILRQVAWVYVHHPSGLAAIQQEWEQLLRAIQEGMADTDHTFGFSGHTPDSARMQQYFEAFRLAVLGSPGAEELKTILADLLAPYQKSGLLLHPLSKESGGHPDEIVVYPVGRPELKRRVKITQIWLQNPEPLQRQLEQRLAMAPDAAVWMTHWLWDRLQRLGTTLDWDKQATEQAQQEALEQAGSFQALWREGLVLAKAGQPLSAQQLRLLRLEHEAFLQQRSWTEALLRAIAVTGLLFAALVACGVYLFYKKRSLLKDLRRLGVLAALMVGTILLMQLAAADPWRAELLPMLVFAQMVAIAYGPELALLLSGVVSLVVGLGLGNTLGGMLVWLGSSATAVIQTKRIRTRTKPIYIGITTGGVAVALELVVQVVQNQPVWETFIWKGGLPWVWAVAAGFLMSGILPFVEKAFGVLTDISLLELTDLQHPLLQELVRRAPSTYNHSVTVGTLAEAAANAIGARGLLVRAGAYFHDIGKMLNPGYFTENQPPDEDHHASLAPTVSSLVIIAHVKDGADLARQHHLPQPIIDFICQHHGTTRVEYFYARATEQSQNENNGKNGSSVDESAYRYPGPKPQTKEACVLMLADAVEGACRSLVDPTPGRLQNVVQQITERRLEDGQFDESDLTLRELRIIQDSLIKSLIAIYHTRIKYPEPKPV
ncbi:MAG: HDIG domain-containing protein [Thermoguttaceae bacterium]|nr:HDIG domain-containing protein [Thermoguttaceae bacterium]MDW8037612.1 HDIG domain-containing protein [Thermoguttaceae bacterium]